MTSAASLAKLLSDAIGENSDASAVTQFLDTGFEPLNYIMSGRYDGGLPFGRLIEKFGESSTGKTAEATEWMRIAQQMNGIAIFEDYERSFNSEFAHRGGMNVERPYFIYNKPKTWEDGNTHAARSCEVIRKSRGIPEEAPIIVVQDSIASAIPRSQMYDSKGNKREIDSYTMNDTTALARVTSTTLKAIAQYAEEFNAIFVYLNQIRLKPGVVYGDPRTTPGGKAMEYYATVRLALGREKVSEGSGSAKEVVGQDIGFQCVKSKLTAPFKKCNLRLTFEDDGFSRFNYTYSLVEFAVEQGILNAAGTYVEWLDGKKYHRGPLVERINAEGSLGDLKLLIRKMDDAA